MYRCEGAREIEERLFVAEMMRKDNNKYRLAIECKMTNVKLSGSDCNGVFGHFRVQTICTTLNMQCVFALALGVASFVQWT